jgi:hypothetical protein
MIVKRLRHEKIEFGPWTLGRWGLPINIFAAGYTLIAVVFTFITMAAAKLVATVQSKNSWSLYGIGADTRRKWTKDGL